MTATLAHRGPDGEGFASRGHCHLGFRRLAIIDVQACSPPFANEDETVWSVCNGQIYNSRAVRAELEAQGHSFRTGVDTEVIPHMYEQYGPDFVQRLNGMFTFAVWDERQQILQLTRDRAGEKPLFYWQGNGELVFASELRALLAHPRVPRAVDPVALRRYLLHDFFPGPLTPIAGIRKLRAGHTLLVRAGEVEVRSWWDLAEHFDSSRSRKRSSSDLLEELDERLDTAVQRRRKSDVPVGLFLSGGIDSSLVLAYMAKQAGPGVPAFSIGHVDQVFDEAGYAERTARHFSAEFNRLVLDQSDLETGLRIIGQEMDEPLGDASTIPTHLLARYARQQVKVVLSGEGADELFGGYPTYVGDRLAEGYRRLPGFMRAAVAGTIRKLAPVSMSNVGLDYLVRKFLDAAEKERVERHHGWFGSIPPGLHAGILAPRVAEALEGDDPYASARQRLAGRDLPDGLAKLLYTDFTMYLQDDLLTKVDRATMLASLEARAPFLDHDLAEFVAGLPSSLKVRRTNTKAILRQVARKYLPPEVLRRRKRGFNIPFSRWLLHGLGDRLRERFSAERVEARGLLNSAGINRLLDEHLEQRADHRKPLFTLLALDLWCDRTYGDGAPVPLAAGDAAVLESRP
jgi:asparagine synthase (glutamine-hydrolysing)